MKILLAIVAIVLCTIGLSLGSAASIAEVNRPRTGYALLLSIVTYTLSVCSIGLEWYWGVLIAIPCALLIPMLIAHVISGTYSDWATDNKYRFLTEGYDETKLMLWVFMGLVLSIVSIFIN